MKSAELTLHLNFMSLSLAETSDDIVSADPPPDIVNQIISEKWKFLEENR